MSETTPPAPLRRGRAGGERPRVLAAVVVMLAMAAFVFTRLEVTTDITHFLPRGENDHVVDLARRIATGELTRTMVLLVDCRDRDEAAVVSHAFEAELRAEPSVANALDELTAGPPQGLEEALWKLYEPRRFGFLATDAIGDDGKVSDAAITKAVAELKQRLGSPMSSLITRVAPSDPFLILPKLFEKLSAASGSGLAVVDDRFVTTEGGAAAVLMLRTHASPSDSTVQRPLLTGVQNAFARLQRSHGTHLRLSQSGVNRHAVAAEASMQSDMQRVSVVSIVGLLVLYLLLFRSIRPALLSLPVLAAGFLAGTTACLLAFGRVHGLTLAFGSSLLGVAVDFSLHFYSHQALAPDANGPRATMRRIQNSLLLCAATTIVGFITLLASTFPGMRELAVFSAAGLAASLAATWLLMPALTKNVRVTKLSLALTSGLRALESKKSRWRRWLALPLFAVIAVIAIGLPRATWNDGVQSLNRVDQVLRAEDDAVHARVARFEQRRVLVTEGATEAAALREYANVAASLSRPGNTGGFGSAAGLLPSAERQASTDAMLRRDATLWPRLRNALEAAGFKADAFQPFADDLTKPAPPPIAPSDLVGTPLEALVRPFRLDGPSGTAWLTFVQGGAHEADLAAYAAARAPTADLGTTRLVDIEATLSHALSSYRTSMVELLLLGVLAVIALVALKERNVKATLFATAPPLLAAAGTVGILALLGVPLNLMSLMALLMIVSMGDDYGIFLVDDVEPASRDATYLSVFSSALSTIFGFGLLALSEQPALRSIGLASSIGIVLCVLLAVATGALFVPSRPVRDS